MSTGLAAAGWRVDAGVEWDPDAAASWRLAHPDAEMAEGDAALLDLRPVRGQVHVVAGGPPCQPYSKAGRGLGARDGRDGWPGFLRAVEQIRSAAVLAENVPGLARADGGRVLAGLLGRLRELGYQAAAHSVDAADYGVPQHRRRLLVVGVRGRQPFVPPAPTHGPGAATP